MITERAIFEVGAATRVHAAWFAAGDRWDLLAIIMREGDGPWRCTWRMRHDGPPGGEDSKSVVNVDPTPGTTIVEFAANIDMVMRAAASRSEVPLVSQEALEAAAGHPSSCACWACVELEFSARNVGASDADVAAVRRTLRRR